ncbi:hypothetical protein Tco_0417823 [Tanacetum coccineum]
MADNRTMAQMLQAPIEGYEDAIVIPPINANNFELKQTLINLVQSNQFTGKQDPHNHLRFFNKVPSTFRHPEVPNTSIKLLLFSFSLEGDARTWLDKEPPQSILTWDDLVWIRQKSQKTVKNGQTRTREQKSAKEAGKLSLQALQQNGKDKVVISKALISSPSSKATWKMEKHNGMIGFTLESLTEQTQMPHNELPRWQSV